MQFLYAIFKFIANLDLFFLLKQIKDIKENHRIVLKKYYRHIHKRGLSFKTVLNAKLLSYQLFFVDTTMPPLGENI